VSVAVVFVAGTAIKGVAARILMRGVMRRHPNAFLVTLEQWGVTIPLDESQVRLAEHIRKIVASAPPLSTEQRARLAAILNAATP